MGCATASFGPYNRAALWYHVHGRIRAFDKRLHEFAQTNTNMYSDSANSWCATESLPDSLKTPKLARFTE